MQHIHVSLAQPSNISLTQHGVILVTLFWEFLNCYKIELHNLFFTCTHPDISQYTENASWRELILLKKIITFVILREWEKYPSRRLREGILFPLPQRENSYKKFKKNSIIINKKTQAGQWIPQDITRNSSSCLCFLYRILLFQN